jgi:hypothetical protein
MFVRVASLLLLIALPVGATDWTNYGGNNARNGQSPEHGPLSADVLWSNTDDFSLITWHPFVHDGRVFTVRESGFPTTGGGANDAIVAYDLQTGAEDWRVTLPFGGDAGLEWIAWIGGVRDGRVYASRSDNSKLLPITALDAATGATLWTSDLSTLAWAHDGFVFAPDGDLIVGDRDRIARVDAETGDTVWETARLCPVSGACGAAATADAVFIDEPAPGGNALTKLDMATGARLYTGPVMAGFTDQNTPFLSQDGGTVYFSRSQNNPLVDFLFAYEDTGTGLVELWNRPIGWTTSHEHGLGPDGSIYSLTPAGELLRIDPATGADLDSTAPLSPLGNPSPKTVVDNAGNVYLSNGWASTPATDGRIWAYTADLSTLLFTLTLDRQNAGGPVLADDGTLVVCDRQGVYAYRSPAVWADVGGGLAGAGGEPALAGVGNLLGDDEFTLTLQNGAPLTTTTIVLGFSSLFVPFKGGTLVPDADFLFFGLATDASGGHEITATWPASVASGFTFWVQHWLSDATGPKGFTASNGMSGTTP